MDTATHIAIGVGLTALTTQDPAMASRLVQQLQPLSLVH